MADEAIDQEIQAIGAVMGALAPLSEAARRSVLGYVVKRLNIPLPRESTADPEELTHVEVDEEHREESSVHIKTLKEQKKPRSANEMAAVVAYYLGNVAPANDRKTTIDQKDIETYFKIAGFPLPQQVRNTLPNAKAAGYFDLAGDGEYKLNAVGHNLVAHSMPRGSGPVAKRKPAKRVAKKKAPSRRKVSGGRKRKG